jgi:hypothetical protein
VGKRLLRRSRSLGWRNPFADEQAEAFQERHILLREAAVLSGPVLLGPESVTSFPTAQRLDGDAQPARGRAGAQRWDFRLTRHLNPRLESVRNRCMLQLSLEPRTVDY